MPAVLGRRAMEKQAASTNTLSRFETKVLATEENLKGLNYLNKAFNLYAIGMTSITIFPSL